MKRIRHHIILLITALSIISGACGHSDLWAGLPQKAQSFINQYFPNSGLQSVSASDKGWAVRISDGPGMSFDTEADWTSVNGYGMPLPSVMLYDLLPEKLYAYLQETENLGSVFGLKRDRTAYTVSLLNTSLKYDIATGELSGSDASSVEQGNISRA